MLILWFLSKLLQIPILNKIFSQSSLNNLQAEVQQLKDNSLHSKKRVFEMMMSLLKDLGDIGTVVGGSEFKVCVVFLVIGYF